MNYFQFETFLDYYFNEIALISLLFIAIYYFIYKKTILSLFDPFLFIILATALSNAMVFILYLYSDIRTEYLEQMVLTEISFLAGFFVFKSIRLDKYQKRAACPDYSLFNPRFIISFFYVVSVTHIALQLSSYIFFGIPLLAENRMTMYTGTGMGFIGRILDLLTISGTFLAFYRYFYIKKGFLRNVYNIFYIIFLISVQLLTGNKTNLLLLIYVIFLMQIYATKIYGIETATANKYISRFQRYTLILSIPFAFLVMGYQYVNSGADVNRFKPVQMMTQRIFSFGDIYYLSLPNDNIKSMNASYADPLTHLFKSPLGMLRIYKWDELPIDLGVELYQAHNKTNTLKGPNARYNYFAMLFYKYYSQIIYCFIIGLIVSFVRNKLFGILPRNLIFGVFYTYFSFNLLYMYQDQSYTIAKYIDFFIFMPGLLLVAYLISKSLPFKSSTTERIIPHTKNVII